MRIIRLAVAVALVVMASRAYALNGGTNIQVQNGTISITGQVAVGNGGTGAATFTAHGVLMGEGSSAFGVSAVGTSGQPFLSGGSGGDGAYGALDLSVTGNTAAAALPISRGGTNSTASLANGKCIHSSGGALVEAASDCATPLNPMNAFGTNSMDMAANSTCWANFSGGFDCRATTTGEGPVQMVAANGATFKNLNCVNAAIQGSGSPTHDIVITGRVGACGSQADGTLTCTITGSASANQACATPDVTHSLSPTAGQCFDFKIVTNSAVANNAQVNCTVERTA